MDETVQGGRVAGDGAPDRATQALIVLVAVLASLALLLLHQGQEWHWPWLSDSRVLFAGYTLATAPPLMLALMISRIDERRTWVVIGLTAMLLLGLSLHNGTACFPPGTGCGPVRATYIPSLVVALFILLPFLQAVRDRQPGDAWQPPYPLLFRYAWDNALALAGTALFIGVSWLILWLWAALFVLLGITVFRDLFDELRFIYPANGLMTGFGLVLCRAQGGALRALLRLCLSLCRALLPVIAVLALSFLAVVLLQGVEPLWKTGRAASLLLWLVLGTLLLTNGVFQDGEADHPYPRWLRHVVGAGLLTMPVHAGLAIYAIALRVSQHGWTVDRLTGALVAAILLLHAVLLAIAVLPGRGGWLARLQMANPLLAAFVVATVLATQSPLLDFRAITIRSQLARLERGETTAAEFDVRTFARLLGRGGRQALKSLKADPAHAGNADFMAKIDEALAADGAEQVVDRPLVAADFILIPAGTEPPEALLKAIDQDLSQKSERPHAEKLGSGGYFLEIKRQDIKFGCLYPRSHCLLTPVRLSVVDPDAEQWLVAPGPYDRRLPPLIYANSADGWQIAAHVLVQPSHLSFPEAKDLAVRGIAGVTSDWQWAQVGNVRFPVQAGRPPMLSDPSSPAFH